MNVRLRRILGGFWLCSGAALGGACSAVTWMGPAEPLPACVVAGTNLFDWKGVIHCHSHLSHDSEGTLETIAAAARSAQLDFVVMTDHQTEASVRDGVRGMVDGTLFLVGAEISCRGSSLLAFPLQRPLRRWQHPALLVAEAHEQGALAFLAHAERWTDGWDTPGLDGVEIVNLHAGARDAGAVGTLGTGMFLPVRTLLERFARRDPEVFRRWDQQLAAGRSLPPIGGNDAHANVQLFGPLGGTVGDYREVFLTLSTHVLAERLDAPALIDALRAGRSYVAFDGFGEGRGFDFRGVIGNRVVLPGDTVAPDPGLELRVRVPGAGRISLWRNGVVVAEQHGSELRWSPVPSGVYRVEVATESGRPWLFSGVIRVAP